LSRHTRLRPDLIALDVGKTEGQVVAYLRLLEQGERQVRRTQGDATGLRDRRKRWKSGRTWLQGMAPACEEVSEGWVRKEEELAAATRVEVERIEGELRDKAREERKEERVRVVRGEKGLKRVDRKPAIDLTETLQAQLQREEEQAEWGASLTPAKLDTLQRLIHTSTPSTDSPDVKRPTQSAMSPLRGRRQFGKFERIILDDKAINHLESIPLGDRTKDHETALRILINRRRMRLMKRTKKLFERGMTQGQIEEQGGADAIFLREARVDEIKDDLDVELEFGGRWWAIQAGLNPRLGDEADEPGEIDFVGRAEDGGDGLLNGNFQDGEGQDEGDRLGIGKFGLEKGWDLFDFASLRAMIQ
jgi:hypothetical protein